MTGDGYGAIRRAWQRGHRDHIRFSPQGMHDVDHQCRHAQAGGHKSTRNSPAYLLTIW